MNRPAWPWFPLIDAQDSRAQLNPRFFWTRHFPVVALCTALCEIPAVRAWLGFPAFAVAALAAVQCLAYLLGVYSPLYARWPRAYSTLITSVNLAVSAGFAAATGRPRTLAWSMYLMYPVIAGASCGRSLLLAVEVLALPLLVALGWDAAGAAPLAEGLGPALGVALAAEAIYLSVASAQDAARAARQEREERARAGAVEEVRRHAARELHCTLGAALTEVSLWLEVAAAASGAEAKAALERARGRAQAAVDQLRSCTGALGASGVSASALATGLRSRLQGLCEAAGVALELEIACALEVLPAERAWRLVRFVEEAALNAVRHGRPRRLAVSVRIAEPPEVEVRDDGRGFRPALAAPGRGLQALREHAEALGAESSVQSAPGQGTRVALAAVAADPFDHGGRADRASR